MALLLLTRHWMLSRLLINFKKISLLVNEHGNFREKELCGLNFYTILIFKMLDVLMKEN